MISQTPTSTYRLGTNEVNRRRDPPFTLAEDEALMKVSAINVMS